MVEDTCRKLKDICLEYLFADGGYKCWYLMEILNVLEPNMKRIRDMWYKNWYHEECVGDKI